MAAVSLAEDVYSLDSEDALTAGALGFMPRILVLTTLPHSKPTVNRFERINGRHSLRLEAPRSIGLPYGVYPRLILACLTTQAIRTKSRAIDLGRTPNDFARKIGVTPISGPRGTTTRLLDQLQRLCSTRLTWRYSKDFRNQKTGSGFIVTNDHRLQNLADRLLRRPRSWRPRAVLSHELFPEVTRSAVPVDLRAIQHLRRSPLAIDIYVWLTYRMSYLRRPCLIPWEALENQFGSGYSRARDFRRRLLEHLGTVVGLYSTARLQTNSSGLLLLPSPAHVPGRQQPSSTAI